jgi:rubrerythrin
VQLGTFGAILKYATDMEEGAATYYDNLAALASGDVKAAASEMAAASRKNKQLLERTRRMEMQEMILEAISGLDTVNFDTAFGGPHDLKAGLAHALDIEGKAASFYSDSASKLGFLGNVKKTLEKLGKDRVARSARLRSLQ